MEILADIPVEFSAEEILERLHLGDQGEAVARAVRDLVDQAQEIARPKAVYEVCYLEGKGEQSVSFGGQTFESTILRSNLDQVERVFPYVATAGRELEVLRGPADDFLSSFYVDTIQEVALRAALTYLARYLEEQYAPGKLVEMNPGSLPNWPITEQRPLFAVFGDVEALIGVRLTDSFLMVPKKSVSGVFFPTEVDYVNCQLCPREDCPNRHAEQDPELMAKFGVRME